MTLPRAIIFDLYDTLLHLEHTTRPYARLIAALSLIGEADMRRARAIALTEEHPSLDSYVKRVSPSATIDLSAFERSIDAELASARNYPETINVLALLRSRIPYLGIITNIATPYKAPYYACGLSEYLPDVLFSCAAGMMKPDPRMYSTLLERWGVAPSDALMIGDSVRCDVEGPKAIGMRAVHLDRKGIIPATIATLDGVFQFL